MSAQPGDIDVGNRVRRRRVYNGFFTVGILAMAGVALVSFDAPDLWHGFQRRGWPLIVGSIAAGFVSLLALWRRWYKAAVIGSSAAVRWSRLSRPSMWQQR